MANETSLQGVAQIGEMAGVIWKTLADQGPLPLTKLVKRVGAPRDAVMLGLGWLAREDKIQIDERGRHRVIALR